MGWKRVVCESDGLEAIRLIQLHYSPPLTTYRSSIQEIKSLLSRGWEVHFAHVLREANLVVDCLAKKGHSMDQAFAFWNSSTDELLPLLAEDLV
ncbi:Ribonuclease H-like superfamily [Sesbania bispinosa]|nr:Ribonuclease H-like superfamily [Sesbania bispinosa]